MNEFQRSHSEFSGGESNFDVRSLRSVSTNVSDWETWAQFWMHYRLCRSVFILGPIDRMSKGAFTMQFPLSKATPVTDEGAERAGASPRLVLLLRISPESNSGRTDADGARLCASLARSSAALGRQIVTSGQLLRRLRRRSLTRTMDAAAVLIAVAFFVVLLQDVSIGEYKTQLSRWQPSATSSSWS